MFSLPRSLLLAFILPLSPAWATDPFHPIRTFDALRGPYHRSRFDLGVSLRVPTAKVLHADYDLIRKDFPVTRDLSPAQIDDWLIHETAFLSKDQIDVGMSRQVNTEIPHEKMNFKTGIRPPNYGRALVFEVEGGLIEAKGAGGLAGAISSNSHRNGLMETAESIREFAYSKLVRKALHHSGSDFRIVDSYAIVDYGFKVKSPVDGTFQPAGAILRQSHFREIQQSEQLEKKTARRIERSLREYGITTAYKEFPVPIEGETMVDVLNVQGSSKEKFLYDFGGYRIADRFKNNSVVLPDLFKEEIKPVIRAEDLKVLQPQSQFKKLYESWGGPGENEKIWLKSREIAKSFQADRNLTQAKKSIVELLEPIQIIPEEAREKADYACMRSVVERILKNKPEN